MTDVQNNPESAGRDLQIQKLLEAIANYSPTPEQLDSMSRAKKQMIRNIEKKFNLSKVNLCYKFPIKYPLQSESDCQETPDIYILRDQNLKCRQKTISKQKCRRPLQQKSAHKSESNFEPIKKSRESFKTKEKESSVLKNIQKSIKSGIKCQTPKVVKKEIILTNKKQVSKQNTKNENNFQEHYTGSQMNESMSIKSKLKIKKPNNMLNQNKKFIHLRTENNINFKSYHEGSISKKRFENEDYQEQELELFNQAKTEQKYIIYEEPSEESLFFNSRNNQNIDENTNFQYPKPLSNVSDLKEKLRQTSKSGKKSIPKRHKRTATEGGCSQIKIKLFSNSFKKSSCQKSQTSNKFLFTDSLFKKNQTTTSSNNIMNRTVSSLSNHSLKKGIKICGKINQAGERSLSKGQTKIQQIVPKQPKKHTISKIGNGTTQQAYIHKDNKTYMSTHLFLAKQNLPCSKEPELKMKKSQSKEMKIENRNQKQKQKQNMEINRVSKINSIMTSLKEGYKMKNGAKPQLGLKTTVYR